MLELQQKLILDKAAVEASNLCDRFDQADLDRIGAWVAEGYKRDKSSRGKWEQRTEAAMDLAMQIQQVKSFPWPDCANIAFPLVTIATMQFHARSYPAIISGTQVVKCRVIGPDADGTEGARALRIGKHMSWQRLEQDESWEEQHDRLLINVAVVGTAFKKSYFNGQKNYNQSDLVLAKDLVLDYYAKSVEDCPRKTHVIPLFRNDIYERVKRQVFVDVLAEAWYKGPPASNTTTQQINQDNRAGINPPPAGDETKPFIFLEQHCSVDLDGDGYAEPYIITVEEISAKCVRIVTRFDSLEAIEKTAAGDIIKIRALEYFTKYPFIPSPDGGIYDIGFGVLLGPLNESVNSLINQMIDAGTMGIAAGGFLGRGAKIRGGVYTFAPFEWKRVDSTGDDLRKNLFPLPVREPSAVLFQLLSLLINYVNRVSGATDMLVGENPGQNTPAYTSREMVAQGTKIYNGIFKRIWRSMKEEFRKLYILNGMFLPPTQDFGEAGLRVTRQDYLGDPSRIAPVADPHITSDEARLQKAMTLKQLAASSSGYNIEAVERRLLEAMEIDGIDQIYPGVGDPNEGKVAPLPNPKAQIEQAKIEVKQAELKMRQIEFVTTLEEEKKLNDAQIHKLEAEVAQIIAGIGAEKARQEVEKFAKFVEMLKSRNELIGKQLDTVKSQMEIRQAEQSHRQELVHTERSHRQELVHAERGHQQGLRQSNEEHQLSLQQQAKKDESQEAE